MAAGFNPYDGSPFAAYNAFGAAPFGAAPFGAAPYLVAVGPPVFQGDLPFSAAGGYPAGSLAAPAPMGAFAGPSTYAYAAPAAAAPASAPLTGAPKIAELKKTITAAQRELVAVETALHDSREKAVLSSGQNAASADFVTGYTGAPRVNPMTDRFESSGFHSMEFIVGDALSVMKRFRAGLGMRLVGKSDRTTGNLKYSSYVLLAQQLCFVITAPSHPAVAAIVSRDPTKTATVPHPGFDPVDMHNFHALHGLAVRAVSINVTSAQAAWDACIANGGRGVLPPTVLRDSVHGGSVTIAEVEAYGDVVLRFHEVSADFGGVYLPGYERVDRDAQEEYGLKRIDHIVGNVPVLKDVFEYITRMTGWHRYAEFNAADVGTVDSGLNSVVVGNNSEFVLMPINEPTFGTKRRSQIQIYLEHNSGAGVQHIALMCDDIVATMTKLKAAEAVGFEFLPAPAATKDASGKMIDYYTWVKSRAGKYISDELLAKLKKLDILVDIDSEGVLLQIFTKPLGDRPTVFIEIIQRLCFLPQAAVQEIGGCGGFGKGNFGALFASVELDFKDIS